MSELSQILDDKLKLDLKNKELQLHWLLQITKAINYNLPSEHLFEVCQMLLKDHLKVGKVVIYVHEDKWSKSLEYGTHSKLEDFNPTTDEVDMDAIKSGKIVNPEWLKQFETIVPVYHNSKPLAYAFVGDIESESQEDKKTLLPFIHTVINIIVVAIENKRLGKESIKQAAMKKELQMAAEMQSMLFPTSLAGTTSLQVSAKYIPHQQVGGDYYDYIPLSDHECIIVIADVSGKGMAAALLMSNFQANLRAIIKNDVTLSRAVEDLNNVVNRTAKGERFITMFLAKINTKTNKINYVNAGHNPPILLFDNNIQLLQNGTTGLGMFDELPFLHEGDAAFHPNTLLTCYTDGITELEDEAGTQFGMDRLTTALQYHSRNNNLDEVHEKIKKELDTFRKSMTFNDDVTILSAKSVNQ